MDPFSRCQDLLGSEGPEYYLEPYPYIPVSQHWYPAGNLTAIDPQLDYLATHHSSYQQSSQDCRKGFAAYDPAAHGFSQPPLRQAFHSQTYHLGSPSPTYDDFEQYRHMRYVSPMDPAGVSLSSTESTFSEHALSPDVVRTSHDLPVFPVHTQLNVQALEASQDYAWHLQTPQHMAPMHFSQDHTPVSLRDFQVAPDPEGDEGDEAMEEADPLQPNLHPEELELSENIVSPVDSGLGQSLDEERSVKDEGGDMDHDLHDSDNGSEFNPIRTRKKSHRRTASRLYRGSVGTQRTSPASEVLGSSRVAKPSHQRKESFFNSRAKAKKPSIKKQQAAAKSFPCTFHHYGCASTFASKNEWKRHVSTQHLQLGFYRCDLGSCSPANARTHHRGYNDFNRKDLFTQHCRRMHAPWSNSRRGEDGVSKKDRENFETQLDLIRTRCWIDRREAPAKSSCGFCSKLFVDTPDRKAWEDRMEHVGRHFERDGFKAQQEEIDDGLRDWSLKEGLIQLGKKGEYWLTGYLPAVETTSSRGNRRSKRLFVQEESEDEARDEEDDGEADSPSLALDDNVDIDAESEEEDDDEDAEGEDE